MVWGNKADTEQTAAAGSAGYSRHGHPRGEADRATGRGQPCGRVARAHRVCRGGGHAPVLAFVVLKVAWASSGENADQSGAFACAETPWARPFSGCSSSVSPGWRCGSSPRPSRAAVRRLIAPRQSANSSSMPRLVVRARLRQGIGQYRAAAVAGLHSHVDEPHRWANPWWDSSALASSASRPTTSTRVDREVLQDLVEHPGNFATRPAGARSPRASPYWSGGLFARGPAREQWRGQHGLDGAMRTLQQQPSGSGCSPSSPSAWPPTASTPSREPATRRSDGEGVPPCSPSQSGAAPRRAHRPRWRSRRSTGSSCSRSPQPATHGRVS